MAAFQAVADRCGIRLGFPESRLTSDADLLVVGRAEAASPWHPAIWLYSDWVSDLAERAGDVTGSSHLLSLAFDGIPTSPDLNVSPGVTPALSEFATSLISEATPEVHPFLAIFARGAPPVGHSAQLPLGMFAFDDRHARSGLPIGHVHLMGRARYLLYGAYYWLPRGVWRAAVEFSVDAEAAGHNFRV